MDTNKLQLMTAWSPITNLEDMKNIALKSDCVIVIDTFTWKYRILPKTPLDVVRKNMLKSYSHIPIDKITLEKAFDRIISWRRNRFSSEVPAAWKPVMLNTSFPQIRLIRQKRNNWIWCDVKNFGYQSEVVDALVFFPDEIEFMQTARSENDPEKEGNPAQ